MFKFSRILIAYALAAALALLLGYLVVSPNQITFLIIGMVLFFLALPLLLKWHRLLLITLWGSAFALQWFPGQPSFWFLLGILSFSISFLNHVLFQKQFLRAPEITLPLLFLAAVVLLTAWYRGGIGIRAFGGSSYGGRYYYLILVAIAGYFAFTSEAIPFGKGQKLSEWYFVSGVTSVLPNVAYMLGPAAYFLFYIVPSSVAISQAVSNLGLTDIDRIEGLSPAAIALLCFLFARFGIRGLFDITKPWRLVVLLLTVTLGCLGGFRSSLLMMLLLFTFQFYLEGLLRTHYFPIIAALAICGLAPILFFADKMPSSIQRAVSFLPVNVNSEVLADAKASSEWRFDMWRAVVKDLPKYLVIGKGYAIDPSELAMVTMAGQMGLPQPEYIGSMIAGDYHSGPLSVIVPFGIAGTIGFLWFLTGAIRVLWLNYRYGDSRLKKVNTAILAVFLMRTLSFFAIFGAMNTDLYIFAGLCGMSISLNGGVRRRTRVSVKTPIPERRTLALEPG